MRGPSSQPSPRRTCLLALAVVTIALAVRPPAVSAAGHDKESGGYDSGRLGFTVQIDALETDYAVFGVFVIPGERLSLRSAAGLDARAAAGRLEGTLRERVWVAPAEPGHYPLELSAGGETMRLNVLVMRPAAEAVDGVLDGYRIGSYPARPYRGLEVYRAPRGYVEVTPALRDLPVSPHFTLGQFLCKQASGWPKFLVLREELLIKLERVLEALNAAGVRADSLTVMSGYRTPWYNRAIGNRTTSSRHLYGGAADVYVDVAPADGTMDDLDGDGRVTKADADYLYDMLDRWSGRAEWRRMRGGLASYGSTPAHGPFVHVDARGYRARWGR